MTPAAAASAQWQDHIVRAGVTYNAPWRLLLSGSYQFQSGAWSGPVVSQAPANPAFGPSTLTLSNGRLVSNPLATTVRVSYPTRGDGQLRTELPDTRNVPVGRQVALHHLK